MITTLALSIALNSGSSGAICKVYQPSAKSAALSRKVIYRGIGPKRLGQDGPNQPKLIPIGPSSAVNEAIIALRTPIMRAIMLKHADTVAASSMTRTGTELLTGNANLDPISLPPQIPSVTSDSKTTATAANMFAEPAPIAPMEKLVTVSLNSTPLETVVGILSKQAGINIVLASKPDQKVSLNVKEMPLSEAVRHLAALAGVKSLKVKNTIVLAEESALKAAYPLEYDAAYTKDPKATDSVKPPVTAPEKAPEKVAEASKVITLKFLNAGLIVGALQDFLAKQGVTAVALPGSVVPTLGAGGLSQQGGGQNGQAGLQVAGGGGGGNVAAQGAQQGTFDPNSRKLFVTGPAKAIAQLEAIIADIDVQRRQVAITVSLFDVSDEAIKEQGITWTPGQFSITENTSNSFTDSTFQRTGINFAASMKALQTQDKARLLSKPNVNVMDGETSSILIGERRQFPIVNGTTPNGQFIFSTQEIRVGITLDVSASIASDGSITLAVRPEVSSIIGFLSINGGNYPQVATRSSNNTITLKDGETAILGGLLREEDIKNFERMPLLSNIPILGELFKNRRTEKRKSQLIISITPDLIKQ